MTTLARDAEHVISATIFVSDARVCHHVERRRMTFETTRGYRPAELNRPIAVARAVDPARYFGPVRNGKLKELIVLVPVEICLPFASRADDDIETFGERDRVGRRAEDTDLKEALAARFHSIMQLRLSGEDVFAGRETTENRSRVSFA